jgi:hypothetical protein
MTSTSSTTTSDSHEGSDPTCSSTLLPDTLSPCYQVRRSCVLLMEDEPWTSSSGKRSVTIEATKLTAAARSIVTPLLLYTPSHSSISSSSCAVSIQWDEHSWHYTASSPMCLTYLTEEQRIERVALYIMALDALNFCFWPIPRLNYEHLAMTLKSIAEQDEKLLPMLSSSCSKDWNDQHYGLSPYKLRCITVDGMNRLLQESQLLPICDSLSQQVLPNLQERCRLWNELGEGLICRFQGKAIALLQACQKSADYLVYLVVQTFPGFHDTAIDDCGRQVAFYKRAQILVGDIWASLRTRCTYCDFQDIHKLTMFPDYRVPQLLRHMQILTYSPELARRIDSEEVIMAGSMDELYIRAATVVAVEQMVQVIKDTLINSPVQNDHHKSKAVTAVLNGNKEELEEVFSPEYWCAMKLDWHLWQMGEALENQGALSHHHRVRTIFY